MKRLLSVTGIAMALAFVGAASIAAESPAARVTDKTSGNGAIMPPGAPTVLICGNPAARVGDRATGFGKIFAGAPQTATVTSIAIGSATVIIGGSPAARTTDRLVDGSVVTTGCPTVLIGS